MVYCRSPDKVKAIVWQSCEKERIDQFSELAMFQIKSTFHLYVFIGYLLKIAPIIDYIYNT